MPGSSHDAGPETCAPIAAHPLFCLPLMTTASVFSSNLPLRSHGWPRGRPGDASPLAPRPTTRGSGQMRFALPSS